VVNISILENNILTSLCDQNGNALTQVSSGSLGFKGAKKLTPYVGSLIIQEIIKRTQKYKVSTIGIVIKGINISVRDSMLKTFIDKGLIVVYICDVTPIPHNGCRPKKRRKV
jgi:small subunit ribosomal protein S11